MRELRNEELVSVSGGGVLTLDPVIVNGPPPRGGGGGGYTGGPSGPVAPPPHTVPDTPELEVPEDYENYEDHCGMQADGYPDGVDSQALNQLALEAADMLRANLTNASQEIALGLYQTSSGELVIGQLHFGSADVTSDPNMGDLSPADLVNNAPGQLVGIMHNHPSDNPALSFGDRSFAILLRGFGEDLVSGNLVQYIATTPDRVTPNGVVECELLTAHTGTTGQNSSTVGADGCNT